MIAHDEPGTCVFGGTVRQVVSTGGTAAAGNRTVTESESMLNTNNSVPSAFETTVCALLTAIVVSEPEEKFNASTAPRIPKPFTVAVGTAANPVASAVGTTTLDVGPGRGTRPIEDSVEVFEA